MEHELKRLLESEIERGGRAYIRNVVAAEQAVLQGRFNIAKLLRAMAHSQRIIAMEAARLLDEEQEQDILSVILDEIGADKDLDIVEGVDSRVRKRLEQSANVREKSRDIVQRAIVSLQSNSDVLESDVAQVLWGCYGCGAILEGAPPHACPFCGVLSVEFEAFGPFYSATAEHLSQLRPEGIITILDGIPDEVEAVITAVDDDVLRQKPSRDEWCVAEIVGHMLETDMLFVVRVQRVLEAQGAELKSPLPPWKLHEGKGYETMPVDELMIHMRAARARSLDIVRNMTPEDWARKGQGSTYKTSILDLGTWLANHDRGHLEQIKRLCKI
ncbi:MAG: DinB family protein [Chloroflexota bacterium]